MRPKAAKTKLTGNEHPGGDSRITITVAVKWRVGTASRHLAVLISDTPMTQSSGTVAGASALSFPQRVIGMLFSPRATFESVVAVPKWVDVLILTILVGMVSWGVFLWSPVGSQAFQDQMIQQAEQRAASGGGNAAQAVEGVQRMFPYIRGFVVGSIPIIAPIFVAVIAGLLYGIFGAILGGGGSYKQTLAVVTHAGIISMIGGLVVLTLNYVRATMTSATTLGVFVTMLPEDSFLVKLLSAIDLVWVWYLVILAMGLGVLYRRKTATIASSFLGIYLVIAVIIAIVKSRA
jgi:hypothetical protein